MKQKNLLKDFYCLYALPFILAMAFAGSVLISCDKNNDNLGNAPVVGLWKSINTEVRDDATGEFIKTESSVMYMKFMKERKFEYSDNSDFAPLYASGTWKIVEDKLIMDFKYASGEEENNCNFSFTVTGDRLVLEDTKIRATFERFVASGKK